MRFTLIIKASEQSEAGTLPSQEQLGEVAKYNEKRAKGRAPLAGDGVQSSSQGARVTFSGGTRSTIDGPFAETKELIGGP